MLLSSSEAPSCLGTLLRWCAVGLIGVLAVALVSGAGDVASPSRHFESEWVPSTGRTTDIKSQYGQQEKSSIRKLHQQDNEEGTGEDGEAQREDHHSNGHDESAENRVDYCDRLKVVDKMLFCNCSAVVYKYLEALLVAIVAKLFFSCMFACGCSQCYSFNRAMYGRRQRKCSIGVFNLTTFLAILAACMSDALRAACFRWTEIFMTLGIFLFMTTVVAICCTRCTMACAASCSETGKVEALLCETCVGYRKALEEDLNAGSYEVVERPP